MILDGKDNGAFKGTEKFKRTQKDKDCATRRACGEDRNLEESGSARAPSTSGLVGTKFDPKTSCASKEYEPNWCPSHASLTRFAP